MDLGRRRTKLLPHFAIFVTEPMYQADILNVARDGQETKSSDERLCGVNGGIRGWELWDRRPIPCERGSRFLVAPLHHRYIL
jgi:hypothetical protein